ncbi:AMP-binding protein [Cohnella sp. 56]|uniref:AMP-binding protein n=1 Tax=Cohnella sp. 56 TaxID=3113722 RepID=UPI0030E9CF6A
MLAVNNDRFTGHDLKVRYAGLGRLEALRSPEGKRFAVCVRQAFDLIAIVLYIRQQGGSVLLLHASTPGGAAEAAARKADCACLIYGGWDNAIPLQGGANYEPSILQYSSGTSREPALIARSWRQVETEIEHYNRLFAGEASCEPVVLVPVSHSFGLICGTLASMARGEEPLVVQDQNPKYALQAIRSRPRSLVYAVPFLFSVMDAMARREDRFHRMVVSGSPPTDPLLARMKLRGDEVWQQYGCTEAGCLSVARQPAAATDVGRPLGHIALSIVPDETSPAAPGSGEIVAVIGEQTIRTRDLGFIRPQDGRLHVIGRLDELINVSGLKVVPSEVESVILRMPGVSEAVVLRTGHKVWGEAVRAIVVAEPSLGAKEIRAWCIRHLPAYKVPGVIDMAEEIPRTPAGKISRKYLQELER